MPFEKDTTITVLSLLAMTVLSDKKVYATEIESFVKTARALEAQNCFQEKLSEAKLLMWFDLNRDSLRAHINTPGFEKWYSGCLKALGNIENKPQILQAMMQIANSDHEFHFGENALIKLTARHWNVALPVL